MLNQVGMPALNFIQVIFCCNNWLIQTLGLRNMYAIIYCFHCDPVQRSHYGDWTTKKQWLNSSRGRNVSLLSSGTPSFRFNGYWVLSPGVKQPGRETDHLFPSSDEGKNEWTCTFTRIHFHSVCRDSFTLVYLTAFFEITG